MPNVKLIFVKSTAHLFARHTVRLVTQGLLAKVVGSYHRGLTTTLFIASYFTLFVPFPTEIIIIHPAHDISLSTIKVFGTIFVDTSFS